MKRLLVVAAAVLFNTLALADVPAIVGDAEKGKTKSVPCAACHGPDGNSIAPSFPKIAGQHADYLEKQLIEFKSGLRNNPIMAAQVANLTPEDMADLASYFAQQKPSVGEADPTLVTLGEKLYRGGDRERGIPACMACHGPQGDGNGPAKFPHVSGQYAAYAEVQLKAYRDGSRKNGPKMNDIAKNLTDEDIAALASYMQGLH